MDFSESPGIRTTLLWLPNPGGKSSVKSLFQGRTVYPSHAGSNGRGVDCGVRAEEPRAFTYEECILFRHPTQEIHFAYPVVGAETFKMPGVDEPCELSWKSHAVHGGMSSMVMHCNGATYFRIYPGAAAEIHRQCTHPAEAGAWSSVEPLADGCVRLCWVGWQINDRGNIVGYAWPVVERTNDDTETVQLDVRHRSSVVEVEGHVIILSSVCRVKVSACRRGDNIIVVITEGNRNNGTLGAHSLNLDELLESTGEEPVEEATPVL